MAVGLKLYFILHDKVFGFTHAFLCAWKTGWTISSTFRSNVSAQPRRKWWRYLRLSQLFVMLCKSIFSDKGLNFHIHFFLTLSNTILELKGVKNPKLPWMAYDLFGMAQFNFRLEEAEEGRIYFSASLPQLNFSWCLKSRRFWKERVSEYPDLPLPPRLKGGCQIMGKCFN